MEALGRAARAIERFRRAYGREPLLDADDSFESVLAHADLAIVALSCPEQEIDPSAVQHVEDLLHQISMFEPRLTEGT